MTDRELLEMAANAAGCVVEGYSSPKGLLVAVRDGVSVWWNPLSDDSDALQLAVKLGIGTGRCFQVVIDSEIDRTGVRHTDRGGKYDSLEEHGTDPYAATRRAIVLAAANIGKQIKGGQHGTE